MKKKILDEIIIGAGPSGLSYGLFSNKKKIILEKNDFPGGHASSFKKKGFTLDYGPHILFSKNKDILNFIIATLGKNVSKCKRNNKISFKKKLVNYPFENDLASLDAKDNYDCLNDFLFNSYKNIKPKNLEQWLLKKFGKSICKKYLFPYNEKVWNLKVKNLSMYWSSRIPSPPASDIIKGSLGIKTEGYLHQLYYHYPKKNGYQSISESWAKKLNINFNSGVKKIYKVNGKLMCEDINGNKFSSKKIISTMSIKDLVKSTKFKIPKKIKKYVSELIINPMLIISLGIKGYDKNKYTAIYFPESDFPVNRISFPKTFSKFNSPSNCYSIQAEITCRKSSKIWKDTNKNIINIVQRGLIKRGIIPNHKSIIFSDIKRVKESYVVYDTKYEKNINIIRNWFKKQNIYLLGRFSFFEYINVDMAVDRSLKLYRELNKIKVSDKKILNKTLTNILN